MSLHRPQCCRTQRADITQKNIIKKKHPFLTFLFFFFKYTFYIDQFNQVVFSLCSEFENPILFGFYFVLSSSLVVSHMLYKYKKYKKIKSNNLRCNDCRNIFHPILSSSSPSKNSYVERSAYSNK